MKAVLSSSISLRENIAREVTLGIPTLGPKPGLDGCHGIKPEPLNDTLYYDFVNYSATDLESSSADLTTLATTPYSSSGDDFLPNATGTVSI